MASCAAPCPAWRTIHISHSTHGRTLSPKGGRLCPWGDGACRVVGIDTAVAWHRHGAPLCAIVHIVCQVRAPRAAPVLLCRSRKVQRRGSGGGVVARCWRPGLVGALLWGACSVGGRGGAGGRRQSAAPAAHHAVGRRGARAAGGEAARSKAQVWPRARAGARRSGHRQRRQQPTVNRPVVWHCETGSGRPRTRKRRPPQHTTVAACVRGCMHALGWPLCSAATKLLQHI